MMQFCDSQCSVIMSTTLTSFLVVTATVPWEASYIRVLGHSCWAGTVVLSARLKTAVQAGES